MKLYLAGATTNSQDGVTDLFGKCVPVLEEMIRHNMPLLVISPLSNNKINDRVIGSNLLVIRKLLPFNHSSK